MFHLEKESSEMTHLKKELNELLQIGNIVDQLSIEKSVATTRNALLKATKENFEILR